MTRFKIIVFTILYFIASNASAEININCKIHIVDDASGINLSQIIPCPEEIKVEELKKDIAFKSTYIQRMDCMAEKLKAEESDVDKRIREINKQLEELGDQLTIKPIKLKRTDND